MEPPTGNEEDEDYDFGNSSSEPEICEKDSGLCKLKHLILKENPNIAFENQCHNNNFFDRYSLSLCSHSYWVQETEQA